MRVYTETNLLRRPAADSAFGQFKSTAQLLRVRGPIGAEFMFLCMHSMSLRESV